MHEASIAQYAFDIINETIKTTPDINGKKIKKITFGIGKPYTVMKESFDIYFSELVKGTRLEGSEREYEKSELTGFFVSSIDIED
jgi:Zn finger protein HypA/HybF involved in hydrogenase expression